MLNHSIYQRSKHLYQEGQDKLMRLGISNLNQEVQILNDIDKLREQYQYEDTFQ